MTQVNQLMKAASEAYYAGTPIMSDVEYDALERIHGQMIEGFGDKHHVFRMYSLQKHYDRDGDYPIPLAICHESIKLDGAALDLTYINGDFTRALTRGNGIKGRDVTANVQQMHFPRKIKTDKPLTQITGECVASLSVENSRNFASGALNTKCPAEFYDKMLEGKMLFVAYSIQHEEDEQGILDTYYHDMLALEAQGFVTVLDSHDQLQDYPTDGTVYRINDNANFNRLGFTDKFPRGAFAHKAEGEVTETILLDVVWQTGKSGKVTPVAILEPVMIGEAMVARATLNNMAYIEALGLEIGCTVEVIRAGEIIPKIVGRAD